MGNVIFGHFEGDSITAGDLWPSYYRSQSKWPWRSKVYAVNSATIQGNSGNSVVSREPTVAANFQSNCMNVLVVAIGTNNFGTTTTATNDADMAALAAYCDRMRLRGFYVVPWTLLPQGTAATNHANFNTNRTTYMPQYRAMVGVNCHAIIDVAADPIMGPDATGDDSTLIDASGIHPTTLGEGHLARIATPVLDSFGRAATGGLPTSNGVFGFDTRRFRVVF